MAHSKSYRPFQFQQETWQHILNGSSGLVNAPTGTGKTFSVFLGALIQFINANPETYQIKGEMACSYCGYTVACFG
jgi:ATP-dependent Lhr-like helicase